MKLAGPSNIASTVALRALGFNAIAIGVGHVAETRGAKADRRDHEVRAPQANLVHRCLGHRLPRFAGIASTLKARAAGGQEAEA